MNSLFDIDLHEQREALPIKHKAPSQVENNKPSSEVGSPLLDSGCFAELQTLLKGFNVQSPKKTAFGVSPPVRNGRNGGAENPLTFDPTWQKLTRTYVLRNLHAIRKNERRSRCLEVDGIHAASPRLESTPKRREPCRKGMADVTPSQNAFSCKVRYYHPNSCEN